MKILTYQYTDVDEDGWSFEEVELRRVNLLVGDSATGKTRFLNTVFNLGGNAVRPEIAKTGQWRVTVEIGDAKYGWELCIEKEDSAAEPTVAKEKLWQIGASSDTVLVERDKSSFIFQEQHLPKLSRRSTSIALLKDESEISTLHQGFRQILRRDFSSDALEKNFKNFRLLIPSIDQFESVGDVLRHDFDANTKLYILSKRFPQIFERIKDQYQTVFPFIKKMKVTSLAKLRPTIETSGHFYVFAIKEEHSNEWFPSSQLSSGMQKVLLMLTDIHSMPDGGIYLIDEYENSLGISAINTFPMILSEVLSVEQFIITSHHPYIINNVPVENWLIFHRVGNKVQIRYGEDNIKRYGRSSQESFFQLVNDRFFVSGVE